MTTDDLADGICLRAGRIAAAEAELIEWIGEFDRRNGWAGVGMLSCAQWLSWRIGLSPGAAPERVRVAGRLRELPVVAKAFAAGQLSWSQVRAITRVARADDGIDWVGIARSTSGAQIEKLVRGMRRAQAPGEAERDCERAAWLVRTRKTYDADGNLVMTIYAKAEVAPVVETAFDAKRAQLEKERAAGVPAGTPDEPPPRCDCEYHQRRQSDVPRLPAAGDVPAETPRLGVASPTERADVPAGTPDVDAERPPPITDGDALLALAQDALCTASPAPDAARRNRFRMTASVDPLSGWGRLRDGELLPPTSLKATMRSLPGRGGIVRLRPLAAEDLRLHDLGRRQREVSANLRELLGSVDGERCRFPGCPRRKKLHAHHVRYWSDGGPTDLANLVLVCSRHHTVIHAQGIQLVLHPDRRLEVCTVDGVAVLHLPTRPWGDPAELDPLCRIGPATITPPRYKPGMDLGYVVSVLLQQSA